MDGRSCPLSWDWRHRPTSGLSKRGLHGQVEKLYYFMAEREKRRRYKHAKCILRSDYSVNSFFTSELQYKQNTKDLENTLQSRNFNWCVSMEVVWNVAVYIFLFGILLNMH